MNKQEVAEDLGSVYEGLSKLTNIRKAHGKLYRSVTMLRTVVLGLRRPSMPNRILAHNVYAEEVERLAGRAGHRPAKETRLRVWCDGKAMRGMHKTEEAGSEYLLSLYDVEQMSQAKVGHKENEIMKAPLALSLKLTETSQE